MQVLKLLPLLPDARERAQQEIAVQLALGFALGVTQGPGSRRRTGLCPGQRAGPADG